MQTEIKKWGNSAALRIPAKLLARAGMDVNSQVDVIIDDGKLVISPMKAPEYTLEELLAKCPDKAIVLDEEDQTWLSATSFGKEAL